MVVCVVGDVDVDKVFETVDKCILKGRASGEVKNIMPKEPFEINEKYFQIAQDRLQGINQKGELNLFDIDYE